MTSSKLWYTILYIWFWESSNNFCHYYFWWSQLLNNYQICKFSIQLGHWTNCKIDCWLSASYIHWRRPKMDHKWCWQLYFGWVYCHWNSIKLCFRKWLNWIIKLSILRITTGLKFISLINMNLKEFHFKSWLSFKFLVVLNARLISSHCNLLTFIMIVQEPVQVFIN